MVATKPRPKHGHEGLAPTRADTLRDGLAREQEAKRLTLVWTQRIDPKRLEAKSQSRCLFVGLRPCRTTSRTQRLIFFGVFRYVSGPSMVLTELVRVAVVLGRRAGGSQALVW